METLAIMIILVPILLPLLNAVQIDLVHFGIVLLVNLVIGQITPPLGFNLFVMQSMTGKEQTEIALAALPFFAMLVLAVALITVFPAIVTALPDYVLSR
jgi:TRAP-type C4-dicarboxylate transport system permease large subunit